MNSMVRLRDLDTEEVEVYTLVYPNAANIANNIGRSYDRFLCAVGHGHGLRINANSARVSPVPSQLATGTHEPVQAVKGT